MIRCEDTHLLEARFELCAKSIVATPFSFMGHVFHNVLTNSKVNIAQTVTGRSVRF